MKRLADSAIPVVGALTKEVDPGKVDPECFDLIRIFPSSPGRLALQIRTKGVTSPHGKKSRLCYSHATLGLTEAVALRQALHVWISEWDSRQIGEAMPDALDLVKTED